MVLLDREQGRRMVALAYKTPEDTAGPCGAEAQEMLLLGADTSATRFRQDAAVPRDIKI
jgi:hypothetical protein